MHQLEAQLTGEWHPPIEWDISRSERTILAVLIHREVVSLQGLNLLVGASDDNTARVMIWKLRQFLRPFNIKVRNRYGIGWYLTKADKAKLKAMAA